MADNSPTCILSSSCLQGPPNAGHNHQQNVSTISSEVESSSGGGSGAFFCERCLYQQSPSGPLPSNHSSCCPINTILPAIANAQEGSEPKSSKASKMSGWKTSKFFSKTMSSGEILRGLKKLSMTSTTDEPESKSLKSRLSNLKKRSSCGNDDVTVDVEAMEASAKQSQKTSATSTTTKSPILQADLNNKSSSQDEGIVCKKEDLKAIICGASKRILCSPARKRAELRQTKSASFEPPDDGTRKEPVRRAGSEESRTRKTMISLDNEPQAMTKVEVKVLNAIDSVITTGEITSAPLVTKVEQQEPVELPQVQVDDSCISTVKWDECEVVDAVLIGDAIETFLKGSMSSAEKKVSFRKNSCEKKA